MQESQSIDPVLGTVPTSTPTTPPKRGRGRPRKNPLPEPLTLPEPRNQTVGSASPRPKPPLPKAPIPSGWEPRAEWDQIGDGGGYLVSAPRDYGSVPNTSQQQSADIEALFRDRGLDPAFWEITKYRTSQWDVYDGRTLEAFKVEFVPKFNNSFLTPQQFEEITSTIKKWRDSDADRRKRDKVQRAGGENNTYVHENADLQIGKKQGDDGTPQAVNRFLLGNTR